MYKNWDGALQRVQAGEQLASESEQEEAEKGAKGKARAKPRVTITKSLSEVEAETSEDPDSDNDESFVVVQDSDDHQPPRWSSRPSNPFTVNPFAVKREPKEDDSLCLSFLNDIPLHQHSQVSLSWTASTTRTLKSTSLSAFPVIFESPHKPDSSETLYPIQVRLANDLHPLRLDFPTPRDKRDAARGSVETREALTSVRRTASYPSSFLIHS